MCTATVIVVLAAVVTSTLALPAVFALRLPKPVESDVSTDLGLCWLPEAFVSERASVSRSISLFLVMADH